MNIMTTNNHVDHSVKDTIEEKSFQVVLVDIKMAAYKNQIHCVQRPLNVCSKFVALSYQRGQVPETMVDTQLGYVAKITSFELASFYLLCGSMAAERHLKNMEYVWVDAICVDQQDPNKQKTAMYQMSHIYEQARFIVVVPDLHLLRSSSDANQRNHDIIQHTMAHRAYIYPLLHGQQDKIAIKDEWFLNSLKIDDPHLRYLLTNYTEHFAEGLMRCKHHNDSSYDPNYALSHLFEAKEAFDRRLHQHHHRHRHYTHHLYKKFVHWIAGTSEDPEARRFAVAHQCHTPKLCPFSPHHHHHRHSKRSQAAAGTNHILHQRQDEQQMILDRSQHLRQSVEFLADLIREWSTDAWVTREYCIVKQKMQREKMKYWFLQLTTTLNEFSGLPADDTSMELGTTGSPDAHHRLTLPLLPHLPNADDDSLCFFEFDFNPTDDALLQWHRKIAALS